MAHPHNSLNCYWITIYHQHTTEYTDNIDKYSSCLTTTQAKRTMLYWIANKLLHWFSKHFCSCSLYKHTEFMISRKMLQSNAKMVVLIPLLRVYLYVCSEQDSAVLGGNLCLANWRCVCVYRDICDTWNINIWKRQRNKKCHPKWEREIYTHSAGEPSVIVVKSSYFS